jgi:hypothetical protein
VSVKILQNRIRPAEYDRTIFATVPEIGTTLDDMLAPEYWSHVAKNLKPGSRIEVTAEDGSWFAELYVRRSSANAALVAVLRHHDFVGKVVATDPAVEHADFTVKHRGGAGWSVVRNSDKAIMFEKGETRDQAEKWIAEQSLS